MSARGHEQILNAFPPRYTQRLRGQIFACRYFTVNTLNRDFVATRGFSVIFRRDTLDQVEQRFGFFKPYLDRALRPDCNAFYLNPLLLEAGSRVDPHIDRSLQSFVTKVDPPRVVSVLYVHIPEPMRGGRLILSKGNKQLARVVPVENALVTFDGDLTHAVERLDSDGGRLSLVCEQYALTPKELEHIPALAIQSRAISAPA